VAELATASPPLPPVFGLGIADRLPLHVRNRVGPATGKRLYVIPPVSGATADHEPGGRAGMLPLEFPRHLAGSVFPGRWRGGGNRNRDRYGE
jgi:hypothetical protein